MTSANFFSGYVNDKPTSRVSNPPGGRSNNIFGCDDEPVKPLKAQQENIRPISNIFSAPDENSAKPCAKQDRMKSNIFGEDQTHGVNNAQNKKRVGVNPITGRSYQEEEDEERKKMEQKAQQEQQEDGKSRPIHTSSRVLAPPGGKTSKLW